MARIVRFFRHLPGNRRRAGRTDLWLTLVATLVAGLVSSFAATTGAPLDSVTLQLKWQHQFQFAGYYAAISKGYYRDAGLEVKLVEAQPGLDPVDQVLKGQAQFGVGTSELLLMRAQGKPVVVLAAIYQHSPLVLMALHTNGVSDLHDLAKRPMMIEPQSAELFAYFKYEGIDPHSLKVEHHTFEVNDLISGRVAAMSAYATDEPFTLKSKGLDYLIFSPRAGGIDFYGDSLFTTEEQIQQHPERVRAFREASLRGWDYALAHPDEIIDVILHNYSTRQSREHLQFEAEQMIQLMHPGLIEVGHMNPGRWQHMADTYEEFGMIPRGFALDGFLYNPNPQPDLHWVYWSLGAAGVIAVAALGWVLPLYRLNRNLRMEIAVRLRAEQNLRRAKEVAEGADQAKGRYLAFMAHEVRTPLGGILGMMRMMQAEKLSPQQREDLGLMERSAESLLKLIGDTLDFSKLEAGRIDLEIQPVKLPDFLRDICELFRASAQAKGLAFRYELEPDVPWVVLTDALRLRQVLTNLLSNAIKFTKAGAIEVRVEGGTMLGAVSPGDGGRQRLVFHVRDTGEGISPEAQARLFTPYAQADVTVARRHGGTGLGLSISRRMAQVLGGDIRVQSTPGEGSTFTVEIMVEVPAPSDAKPQS